jgi:hypothetical protein
MQDILEMRVDRTKISISDSFDNTEEKEFRFSRTPEERLLAMEMMRKVAYGYDENSARLQRTLEIAERK